MFDVAMRLMHDHCRCCCCSATEVCSCVVVDSMLSPRFPHSLERDGGAQHRFNAFQKCDRCHEPHLFPFPSATTSQIASSVCSPSSCAHNISQRTIKFVPRVDRISWWSLAGEVAVGFSQIEQQIRAVDSSSVNGRWPSQELHSPRDCY